MADKTVVTKINMFWDGISEEDLLRYDVIEEPDNKIYFFKPGTKILHRLGGKPAIIGCHNSYYENGRKHRLDGPAMENNRFIGSPMNKLENEQYFIHDVHLDKEEWEIKRSAILKLESLSKLK